MLKLPSLNKVNKRSVFIPLAILVSALAVAYGLFLVSRSRTFQFFGEIVPRVETSEKVVALTFDDGPTEYTTEVLNMLADKNVKATFFVMGKELENKLQIGRDIALSGHELGNHSYSHQRMWFKSQAFISEEIESTNRLIREAGYTGVIHFRPPYSKKLFGLPWYLKQNNIKTIMVDVEPDTYGTTSEFMVNYTLENTKPGSIILLHPFCTSCTAQRNAIDGIVDGLHAHGYQFVTVSELLNYKKN